MEKDTLDLSYDIAIRAYETARARLDEVNRFFNIVASTSLSLALSVPILVRVLNIEKFTWWFFFALCLFVVTYGLCAIGRLWGHLIFLHPGLIHENYQDMDDVSFKREILYWSGDHCGKNLNLIESKWRMAVGAMVTLGCQAICSVFWVLDLDLFLLVELMVVFRLL